MSLIRRLSLVVVALLASLQGHAQDFGWNLSFHGFADNREYAKSGRYSQTILGVRIAPEINLSSDSTHFLHVGANFLHEFGSRGTNAEQITPTIYYNYKQAGHDFYIGMFPRKDLLNEYPRALLNDTLNYYRPNIEGLLWRYNGSHFHQQIWIDWTSRQTETEREQFMAGISGRVTFGMGYFAHQVTLWHNAGRQNETSATRVPLRDNGAAVLKLGLDLSRWVGLDSLDINAGGVMAYDRLRGVYDFRLPKGFMSDVYAEYRKIFLANTVYAGEGMDVTYGDRFFTASFYDRLDLGWKPLQYHGLEGKFTLSFHFTPEAIDNQQQFTLQYNLGRMYNKRR